MAGSILRLHQSLSDILRVCNLWLNELLDLARSAIDLFQNLNSIGGVFAFPKAWRYRQRIKYPVPVRAD